jgi:transketolase
MSLLPLTSTANKLTDRLTLFLICGSLKAKFEAFDWDVIEIKEGNNLEAVIAGKEAKRKNRKRETSLCIATYHIWGGVDFMMYTQMLGNKCYSKQ